MAGGRTQGWNDIIGDEIIQKWAEGVSQKVRPAWAKVLILLGMPLSSPALPICLPFFAFWPSPAPHPKPYVLLTLPSSKPYQRNKLTSAPVGPAGLWLQLSPLCSCWCVSNPFKHWFPQPLAWIGICAFRITFTSHSSGRCQDVLSLNWTRSSRSGRCRAKSRTPD